MAVVVTSVFDEDDKFHPQIYLDECLSVCLLEYDRIDIWEGIDINKRNSAK